MIQSQRALALDQSAPSVFNFGAHPIRIVMRDGEPWLVASDVASALGYLTAKDAARHLDDDEKGRHIVPTPGGNQNVTIINESGLYALVLRSRKPEARKFAKWVTSEVLPSIRKTGSYGTPRIDPARLHQAQALAAQVAAVASRTVFKAVLASDDDIASNRWMFGLRGSYGRSDVPDEPWASVVPRDACVASLKELAKMINAPNGMMPTDVELAHLAAACIQRLSARLAHRTPATA
ncbi:BRO-N domain-containing protein [Bordetella bronchiseptica]